MKIYLVSIVFLIYGNDCYCQPPKTNNSLDRQRQTGKNIITKEKSKVIIEFRDSVFVELSVNVFKPDSIIVHSAFINHSSQDIYLYKALLPSDDLLTENAFGFMVENEFSGMPPQILFLDSSDGKYYEGNRQYNPFVIPELTPQNFLFLQSSDSMKFSINIAKFYDLQSAIKSGYKTFSIGYGSAMPLINDKFEHIFRKDIKDEAEIKPVFIFMGMKRSDKHDKYLSQRAYFTITK